MDVEKLRAFIERAERADNIVVADERFRAERYLWNNRRAILALAEERDRLATLARANNDLARHEANGRRELQAENARLREALEPFAREAAEWEGVPDGARVIYIDTVEEVPNVTLRDFRRAALTTADTPEG